MYRYIRVCSLQTPKAFLSAFPCVLNHSDILIKRMNNECAHSHAFWEVIIGAIMMVKLYVWISKQREKRKYHNH